MKLYLNNTSPFSRVVLITAMLCDKMLCGKVASTENLNMELVWVDPWDPTTKLLDVNPFSTIPTLSINNDTYLIESLSICQYLIHRYSPEILQDIDIQQADQVALLGFAKTLMETSFRTAAFTRFTTEDNELIERGKSAISRALIELEQSDTLIKSALTFPANTFAHLYLHVALEYLKFRHQSIFEQYAQKKISVFLANSPFGDICQRISVDSLINNPKFNDLKLSLSI